MEEQLITFDTAKLAKEKGFKLDYSNDFYEPNNSFYCFHRHSNKYLIMTAYYADTNHNFQQYDTVNKETYDAPTQSLLQKWLREVHKIDIRIDGLSTNQYMVDINRLVWENKPRLTGFKIYEEALEKGLQEALKLIK